MSDDGSWGDYVADAGTDPVALDVVSDGMADAGTAVETGVDAIDTSALPEATADALGDASYNATEATSWANWAEGDLADAASWQDAAQDHVQAAQEWLAFGNADAAQEEMAAAATASDIADGVVGQANTDASIGAEYMDTSADALDTAAYDSTAYDTSSVDTAAYDSGSADLGSIDTSADVSSDV